MSEFARAVLAFLNSLIRGAVLGISELTFWSRFPLLPFIQRSAVVSAAQSLFEMGNDLGALIESGNIVGEQAPLIDLANQAGLPDIATTGGPLGSKLASIYAAVFVKEGRGRTVLRAVKIDVPWDATGQEIQDELDDAIAEMEGESDVIAIEIKFDTIKVY